MSVSEKAAKWKQRKRANTMSMKERMESQAAIDRAPPTRYEHVCPSCGFKAMYAFLRCPECERARA